MRPKSVIVLEISLERARGFKQELYGRTTAIRKFSSHAIYRRLELEINYGFKKEMDRIVFLIKN